MRTDDLDLSGPAEPPRSNGELVFDQPWQRRLFATTMALCDASVITYDEFREQLIIVIETRRGSYWESWQDAVETLLHARHVCDVDELAGRAAAFATHPGH